MHLNNSQLTEIQCYTENTNKVYVTVGATITPRQKNSYIDNKLSFRQDITADNKKTRTNDQLVFI